MLTTGLSWISFILKCIPSFSCLFGTFVTKNYWIFDKKPFNIHINGLYFGWFLWHITFIDLHVLTHPCISGMKAAYCGERHFWCALEFALPAFYLNLVCWHFTGDSYICVLHGMIKLCSQSQHPPATTGPHLCLLSCLCLLVVSGGCRLCEQNLAALHLSLFHRVIWGWLT